MISMLSQIVLYFFATLTALVIIYFFAGMAYVKYINDYEKIDKGKKHITYSLAALFWVLLLWALVYNVVALFFAGVV